MIRALALVGLVSATAFACGSGDDSSTDEARLSECDGATCTEDDAAPEIAPGFEVPVFTPTSRGAPRLRVGAGTRSAVAGGVPRIRALVPIEPGLTTSSAPVLYWHLESDSDLWFEIEVAKLDSEIPLLVAHLEGPRRAGVQEIRLDRLNASIDAGAIYRWTVSAVVDPDDRQQDVVAGGGVELVAMPAAVAAELKGANATEAAVILARAGIWYDALTSLSRAVDSSDRGSSYRNLRAALLDQVGLAEVAAQERALAEEK